MCREFQSVHLRLCQDPVDRSERSAAKLQTHLSGKQSHKLCNFKLFKLHFKIIIHYNPLIRLCTWLPGFRSSARVTPQRTLTTALFDYISAGRSTHCAFYHWRLHLSSDCCIDLEQFAVVSPVIAVVASFPQQTENQTFCPVLQT